MHRFAPILAVLILACDYAPAEQVETLSRDVENVRHEQSRLEQEVTTAAQKIEMTAQEQNQLRTNLAAMGSGFNVLSESVVEHGSRVETLEAESARVREDIGELKRRPQTQRPREPERNRPYTGVRLDVGSLEETSVRMRWCEGGEGVEGYLVSTEDVLPAELGGRCWRFGTVALFRREDPAGVRIDCLRDIVVDEAGELRALDCDEPGVVYRFWDGDGEPVVEAR